MAYHYQEMNAENVQSPSFELLAKALIVELQSNFPYLLTVAIRPLKFILA